MEGKKSLAFSEKHTTVPHDIITIDTLVKLKEHSKQTQEAKNNELLYTQGTMFVLNKTIIDGILSNLQNLMRSGIDGVPKQTKEERKILEFVKKFFHSMEFEPIVIIKTADGFLGGSIKDEYLMESVSNFHIRFGESGLSDVDIVGIKEEHSTEDSFEDGFFEAIRSVSKMIREFIFPPETTFFTPIAIYRTIES